MNDFEIVRSFLDYMDQRFDEQEFESRYLTSLGCCIPADVGYAYDCIKIMRKELSELEESRVGV